VGCRDPRLDLGPERGAVPTHARGGGGRELAAEWLIDLLGLPSHSSVGFVTGGQMANFTCLAAARHEVLRAVGWDVEADGLPGAPPVTVVVKQGVHSTVLRALRFLGMGERAVVVVPCDDQDNMRPDALAQALQSISGPTIVTVECGNVNTGAFDDFTAVADLADAHRATGNPTWVHVDGAVMLLPPHHPPWPIVSTASTDSSPGPPTDTNCSTSPTIAASRSAGTRPRTGPR
jgi:hypothetical protein